MGGRKESRGRALHGGGGGGWGGRNGRALEVLEVMLEGKGWSKGSVGDD